MAWVGRPVGSGSKLAVAALMMISVLAGCRGDDSTATTELDIFESGEPICGFVDAELVRQTLPAGTYEVRLVGDPSRRELGRPTAGRCHIENAAGESAMGIIVEHSEAPFGEYLRSQREWETFTFPESEGTGWAGRLGPGEPGGYAVLERNDYRVRVAVGAPAGGRAAQEAAIGIVRAVFRDLIDVEEG